MIRPLRAAAKSGRRLSKGAQLRRSEMTNPEVREQAHSRTAEWFMESFDAIQWRSITATFDVRGHLGLFTIHITSTNGQWSDTVAVWRSYLTRRGAEREGRRRIERIEQADRYQKACLFDMLVKCRAGLDEAPTSDAEPAR